MDDKRCSYELMQNCRGRNKHFLALEQKNHMRNHRSTEVFNEFSMLAFSGLFSPSLRCATDQSKGQNGRGGKDLLPEQIVRLRLKVVVCNVLAEHSVWELSVICEVAKSQLTPGDAFLTLMNFSGIRPVVICACAENTRRHRRKIFCHVTEKLGKIYYSV